MCTEITSSIIEAAGTVLAAIIGVGWIGKIVNRNVATNFFNYSNKKHNLNRLMRRAKNSITIVVAYGDNLLDTYESNIEAYLKHGIQVQYLMLSKKRAFEIDKEFYNMDEESIAEAIKKVLDSLERLSGKYNNIEIREIDTFLTASYIGIDIDEDINEQWKSNSIVQLMLYQFHIETPQAPITYFSPKHNLLQFKNTVKSIQDMWLSGKNLNISNYRNSLKE